MRIGGRNDAYNSFRVAYIHRSSSNDIYFSLALAIIMFKSNSNAHRRRCRCDALVLAICWLLQHNFHDCPNYNLSVTHDDYSDLPSQHLSRFVYERQPSVSIIHVGQLSQSDIYSKLKLCALNCNKHIIGNGDE